MGGTPKVCQNLFLWHIYWYQKHKHCKLGRAKTWFLGVQFGGSRGGTLKLCRNICLLYLLISKNNTSALVWAKPKINIWRVHFGGSQGLFPNDVKTFVSWICGDILKKQVPTLSQLKNWFSGVCFWGVPGGRHPQTMSKYLSPKYLLLISKNTGTVN